MLHVKLHRDPGHFIDLLFNDVVLAGHINGVELADSAREIRPDMKRSKQALDATAGS